MTLNPYARFLIPGEDAIVTLQKTPAEIAQCLSRLGEAQADHPIAPGKWSIREIVAHLADSEIAHAFRIRQALAEPGIVVQPWDQDQFAQKYTAYDLTSSMDTFHVLRIWNLRLLATVTQKERSNEVTHPERGIMTLWTLVETMAGHDRNHLLQIAAFAEGK